MQSTGIQALKERKLSGNVSTPLRLRIVAVSKPFVYGSDGKSLLNIGLLDQGDCIKGVCFDSNRFAFFEEGAGVVLRNYIMKNGEIVLTSASKIFKTSPPEVEESVVNRGKALIFPPPPPIVSIKEARNSPQKKTLSVRGRVTNEGMATKVMAKNKEVGLKTITLEDTTDNIKVSLWRDLSDAEVRPGDFVEITHLVPNNWKSEVNLQSTQHSIIKKTEAPLEEKELYFLGCDVGDAVSELITECGLTFNINNNLLETLQDEAVDVSETFPRRLTVKCQGADILSIL